MSKDSHPVQPRIRAGSMNAKYTHHTVQNALLDIMKDMILEQIKQELHEAEYFTILTDESKVTSKKEQVVVAVRYCTKTQSMKNLSVFLKLIVWMPMDCPIPLFTS